MTCEPAITNYISNPRVASTNGYNALNGTMTRDTVVKWGPRDSIKYVSAETSSEGVYRSTNNIAAQLGETWTFSVYLQGTGNVFLRIAEWDGAAGFGDNDGSPFALTSEWVRHQYSTTTNLASVAYVYPQVLCADTDPCTFYAAGWQMELSSSATSYIDGSLGMGYAWDGAEDASTSTRSALTAACEETFDSFQLR
jgi:hypothetical protein